MKTRPVFVLIFAISLLVTGAARANGGGFDYGSGWTGSFSPRGLEHCQILSEDLVIRFGDSHADVEVTYQIHNSGKAVTAKIGFPCTQLRPKEEEHSHWYRSLELESYRIIQDGEEIASKLVEEGAPTPMPPVSEDDKEFLTWVSTWRVSKLKFKAGQKSRVKVSFRAGYSVKGISVSDDSGFEKTTFSYTLSSAAAWKGPIKSGKITLIVDTMFPEEFRIRSPRDRFERDGDTYTWEFTDLEPTAADDLKIEVYQPYQERSVYSVEGGPSGFYSFRGKRYFFHHHRYGVTASSQLPDEGEISYGAENVASPYDDAAWVEGVEGDGIGESLILTVKNPMPLHHLRITPGYAKNEQLWLANNRVSEFKVTLNGKKTFNAAVPDRARPGSEAIQIPDFDEAVSTVKLEIAGVHRGTKYRDTPISYISLVSELEKRPDVQGAR